MSCWLREETLVLAEDYVDFCSGVQQTPPSESAQAMRYLAKEMEQQHRSKFTSLSHEFLDTCGSDPSECLHAVMRELVGDGKMNWGRVVSIFTFTGVLASELLSRRGNTERSRRLAETVADYLGGEKRDWLLENGGWVRNTEFTVVPIEVSKHGLGVCGHDRKDNRTGEDPPQVSV